MDIMWLNGKPVLYIVDVESDFQNTIFISGKQVTNYGMI